MKVGFFMFTGKISFFIMVLLAGSLYGCTKGNDNQQAPDRNRYVSLTPATTEILFSLGLDENIVGVTSYCNFPSRALSKDKIGDFSNPNIEKIISLKPDIIFATGLEQNQVIKRLRALEQRVVVIDPNNFNQLLEDIMKVGKITSKIAEAELLVASINKRIKELQESVRKYSQKPKVFIVIYDKPLMTVSKGSFLNEMIEMAGAVNVASNLPRSYCQISEEWVIDKNPDIILTTVEHNKSMFTESEKFKRINAVVNNRVYDAVNPDIMLRPGPRLVQGLEQLIGYIHKQKE